MSQWALVSLTSDSWSPGRHFAPKLPTCAPPAYLGPLVRLGELAEFVAPQSNVHPGEAVVTPMGISPQTGAAQPSERSPSGAVFRVGSDLQLGDVLVPLIGEGPCVLVVVAHSGLAFSRQFVALRPQDRSNAVVLWATLSSSSGVKARLQLDAGGAVRRFSPRALVDLLVPDPRQFQADVDKLLPNPPVDEVAAAAVVSRWRTISLQPLSSWDPARLFDPLADERGVPIAELGHVWGGRLDARQFREEPFPGSTPALRPRDVGRLSTPRSWALAESRDIVKPESLMVGALSLGVASSKQAVAVARDVLVVDVQGRAGLTAEDVRDRLVTYLRSAAGQRRLASYKTGAAISRLSKKSFVDLRVPAPEDLPNTKPSAAELLQTRLENSLWS